MSQTKQTEQLTHEELSDFHGGEEARYSSMNRNVIFTPGVRHLAERANAFWLIDAISSYYGTELMKAAMKKDSRLNSLHFWRLDVTPEQTATLTAEADSGVPPFVTQEIPFTDFPLDHVRVWSGFDGTYWTLYLPSEH